MANGKPQRQRRIDASCDGQLVAWRHFPPLKPARSNCYYHPQSLQGQGNQVLLSPGTPARHPSGMWTHSSRPTWLLSEDSILPKLDLVLQQHLAPTPSDWDPINVYGTQELVKDMTDLHFGYGNDFSQE